MQTVYRKQTMGQLTITEASVNASFYGLYCNFSIATYVTSNRYFGIRCEFHPLFSEGHKGEGCSFSNIVRIPQGEGSRRRCIEQVIKLPDLVLEVFPLKDVTQATEGDARDICQSVFRYFSSVVETVRKSVIDSFSKEIVDEASKNQDKKYGLFSEKTVRTLLGSLNWPLLVSEMPVADAVKNIIDYIFSNNRPAYYSLVSEGDKDAFNVLENKTGIEHLESRIASIEGMISREQDAIKVRELQAEWERERVILDEKIRLANQKANELLKLVCGEEIFNEYLKRGFLHIENEGWSFLLKPNAHVQTFAPNGSSANLCIHTVNLSCNPIDEMVLAYLHIRHKMDEYLAIAIPHGIKGDFSLEPFRDKVKKK
jgi:hypothetical protein